MTETNLNAPILPGIENRTIVVNDNLPALRALPDACVDLIYLDPPFNSGRAYLNPIGLAEQEERGLLQDIRLPAPQERPDPLAAVQDRLVGFVDVFTMEPGDPNWKAEWIEDIGHVIPALPPILEGAGRAHSPSMQTEMRATRRLGPYGVRTGCAYGCGYRHRGRGIAAMWGAFRKLQRPARSRGE